MKYSFNLYFLLSLLLFFFSCIFKTVYDKKSNFIITGNKYGFGLSKDMYRDGQNTDSLLQINTWPISGKDSFLYDSETNVFQIRYFDTKDSRTYKKVDRIPAVDSPAIVDVLGDYKLLGIFEAEDLSLLYSCIYISPRGDVLEVIHNGNIGSPVLPFYWLKKKENPVAGKPEILQAIFKQWQPLKNEK